MLKVTVGATFIQVRGFIMGTEDPSTSAQSLNHLVHHPHHQEARFVEMLNAKIIEESKTRLKEVKHAWHGHHKVHTSTHIPQQSIQTVD